MCKFFLGIGTAVMLVACGGELPTSVEEVGREVQEETLRDFNGQFRSICSSRGLGRFTGGFSDDVCECALRVVREQVANEEFKSQEGGGIDIPEALEERLLEVCLREAES